MGRSSDSRRVIGWKEYVDFVDWGLPHVKAKVDTGARTSALGVDSYALIEDASGLVAELRLSLYRRHPERTAVVRVPVLTMVEVCNTSGCREARPLIETRLRLGPVVKRVLMTVTSRAGMLMPMILGRKALEGDFIVDVSKKYLLNVRRRNQSN